MKITVLSRELDVAQGFGFNVLGIGLPSVESLDDGAITFDNENANGLTYDEAVSGSGLLPSFDKTNQYESTLVPIKLDEDYGVLGLVLLVAVHTPGTYPWDNGFTQQNINRGFVDYGWIDGNLSTGSYMDLHMEVPTSLEEWNKTFQYSSHSTVVLVQSPFLELAERKLLLQVVQHLYSTC